MVIVCYPGKFKFVSSSLCSWHVMASLGSICRSIRPATHRKRTSFAPRRLASTVFAPRRTRRLALDSVDSSLLDSDPAEPVHLVAGPSERAGPGLLTALREHGRDAVVDVEVGRYDKHGFERPQVPLVAYLDLLADGRAHVKSQPVHLAQWRAFDDLPHLGALFPLPNLLAPSVSSGIADIYQTSLFVGPSGSITPLHRDPYENVFEIAETSKGATKHFCLFPPACSSVLAPPHGSTSDVADLSLVDDVEGIVRLESGSLDESGLARLARDSQATTLAKGDILLLPRGWWHRVQNVGPPGSIVAGIARWWLMRAARPPRDGVSNNFSPQSPCFGL
jgi:hypothetical protein